MADEADLANDTNEFMMSLHLKAAQTSSLGLRPIGECVWCGEPFEASSPKLFCDSECEQDFQRHRRR